LHRCRNIRLKAARSIQSDFDFVLLKTKLSKENSNRKQIGVATPAKQISADVAEGTFSSYSPPRRRPIGDFDIRYTTTLMSRP
jgi:hypothetical protein